MPFIKGRVKDLNNMGEYHDLHECVKYWESQEEIA